jgi:protein ImuA
MYPNKMGPSRGGQLRALAEQLSTLRTPTHSHLHPVAIGLDPIDSVLPGGGLAGGQVHEWIGGGEHPEDSAPRRARGTDWSPPLTLVSEVAVRAAASSREGRRLLVWIGPNAWPYPVWLAHIMRNDRRLSLTEDALFVRASSPRDRIWATDLSLRSGAAAAVITDGSGFDLAATRRLQLAAESGGAMCLLTRPAWERAELSAAATRWLVSCTPSSSKNRRWIVELLRCKGVQPTPHAPRVWTLEQDHASRALSLPADVLHRPGETEIGTGNARRTG